MPPATEDDPPPGACPDRVLAHAHAAISSLLRYAIPPSPSSFAVWYDYHSGDNTMVRRVIDTYLTNGHSITEGLVHEIHARFFDTRRESLALMQTSQRLRSATEQVMGLIAEAGGDTARYGNALGAFSGELVGQCVGHCGMHDGPLATALQRMIAGTQEMAQRSAEVSERLDASARAVSDLQERLEQALREARTDALTGLPNRRAIEDAAAAFGEDARMTGGALSLVLLDIDRFKLVNDTWGHPVGDAVLRRVATILRESLESWLLCGRFGGEEFAVLLPGHDLADARRVAERLRATVGEQSFSVRATGLALGSITVSVGVAARKPGEAWPHLLLRADGALYRAKRTGRNRVVWDEGTAPHPAGAGS